MQRSLVGWVVAVILLAVVTPGLAQQGTSAIGGKITDEQGGVLPGVAIVVTNEATGIFREVTSSEEGTYLATQIVPGRYKIRAQAAGLPEHGAQRPDPPGRHAADDQPVAARRWSRGERHRHRAVAAGGHHQRGGRRQHRDRRSQPAARDAPQLFRGRGAPAGRAVHAVHADGQRHDHRRRPDVAEHERLGGRRLQRRRRPRHELRARRCARRSKRSRSSRSSPACTTRSSAARAAPSSTP